MLGRDVQPLMTLAFRSEQHELPGAVGFEHRGSEGVLDQLSLDIVEGRDQNVTVEGCARVRHAHPYCRFAVTLLWPEPTVVRGVRDVWVAGAIVRTAGGRSQWSRKLSGGPSCPSSAARTRLAISRAVT